MWHFCISSTCKKSNQSVKWWSAKFRRSGQIAKSNPCRLEDLVKATFGVHNSHVQAWGVYDQSGRRDAKQTWRYPPILCPLTSRRPLKAVRRVRIS
jgi:hypothetical protein